MFSRIEKEYRKELIDLYERYIANPEDEDVRKDAGGMGIICGPQFSEDVNLAAHKADWMSIGKLSVEEAKEILQKLKAAREHEKN
ncbi:hypothetical protein D6817_01750 [Candidatus Pacearchaeota archaeon]|nr:MAG: hypothetical protein D6817_01750 [Candidatus Pacearchaeota archaeon]